MHDKYDYRVALDFAAQDKIPTIQSLHFCRWVIEFLTADLIAGKDTVDQHSLR
jgi:hypothetical protein